jgi:rhomboid-related protein 1/2/3
MQFNYHNNTFQTEHKEMHGVMRRALNRYVRAAVVQQTATADEPDEAGDYEEQYSCYPPTLCMILISLVEVMQFVYIRY